MGTSPACVNSQSKRMCRQAGPRRRRVQQRPLTAAQVAASHGEDVFWRQLEEREEGRIAQEADHLFDTSFVWGA